MFFFIYLIKATPKLFYEAGIKNFTKEDGILTYITPNTLLLQPRYKDLREFVLRYDLLQILNLGEGVFSAVVPTCVLVIKKTTKTKSPLTFIDLTNGGKYSGNLGFTDQKTLDQSSYERADGSIFTKDVRELKSGEIPLSEILEFKDVGINYQRVKVGLAKKGNSDPGQRLLYKSEEKESEEDKIFWRGENIDSYYIAPETQNFVRISTTDSLRENERVALNKEYFTKAPKLIWRQTAPYPIATIDSKGVWFARSVQAGIITDDSFSYEYILALLNSSYLRFLYSNIVKESGRVFPQVKLTKLKSLPIKKATKDEQLPLVELVQKILSLKKENHAKDVTGLEAEIDELVFDLYGLTAAERKIVS